MKHMQPWETFFRGKAIRYQSWFGGLQLASRRVVARPILDSERDANTGETGVADHEFPCNAAE